MDAAFLTDLPGGRWREHRFESDALKGNALGDPHVRPLYVWTPPSYDGGAARYPVVYELQGFTGIAAGWFNVRTWERSWPAEIDVLCPEAIVVLLDAFTSIGGSQFVDSPAIGDYHTYLCDEVVPWVDLEYRTSGVRAIQGKSSGGYGAMVTPMLRPGLFHGVATHAGDALFDISYRRSFVEAARSLRDHYDGSFEGFIEDFRSRSGRELVMKKTDHALIEIWAMAAAYSAGEIPFETETGTVREDVFARWLAWDPVRMAAEERYAEGLRGLRAIWIDAGMSDEFFLDIGAHAFRRAVAAAGVDADRVQFELHEGGHFNTSWRYPLALAWLVERLNAPAPGAPSA